MNWIELTDIDQLKGISTAENTSLIFKHSTRCPVSTFVKRAFENEAKEFSDSSPCYYLDLIKHRDISDKIADIFQVEHQSPQLLAIKNGACLHHASHEAISLQSALELVA